MKKTKKSWPVMLGVAAGVGVALRLGGSLLHLAAALGAAAAGKGFPPKGTSAEKRGKRDEE